MQRKRIFLHIGWEKTGSSSLQVVLQTSRAWLESHGYLYPSFGPLPQHIELYRALSQVLPNERHQMIHKVRKIVSETPCENIIFSHERLHACDPALFREMFSGHEVHIIAYLRRYDEALLSHFATMVRWGLMRVSPRATLPLRFARKYLAGADYLWPLLGFSATFGRQNVHPRVYNRELIEGRGLVSDFLSVIGLEDREGLSWPNLKANLSLSAAELLFVIGASEKIDAKSQFLAQHYTREIASALLAGRMRCGQQSITQSMPVNKRRRLVEMFDQSSELLSREFFQGRPVFEPVEVSEDFNGPPQVDLEAMKAIVANASNVPDAIKLEISHLSSV